jgi:nicotinate-nucleotide--dimethylbenzimidazole phosphoribosyltransferase
MTIDTQSFLSRIIASIEPPSEAWRTIARAHLDALTKPLGSLGRIEDIAAQMVSIRQERSAEPLRKAVYVFAADHGVTAEGVSAYPSEVTRQMVLNFVHRGAAINVLAKLHHVDMNIVDVGVDADFGQVEGMLHRKIRRGSRNMLHEPAMSEKELTHAVEVGASLARDAAAKGENIIAVGEMGIGNTTAASAMTAALTRTSVARVTGTGTGLSTEAHIQKQKIIESILDRHFPAMQSSTAPDPLHVLGCIGGLEIAAMVGLILGGAQHKIAIVADGFISTAAAAIAYTIEPQVRGYLFAGHQSKEPGHKVLLEYISLTPILTLDMRLGEGSGAVLAMPLIESAMAIYSEMATFASAGVSGANE